MKNTTPLTEIQAEVLKFLNKYTELHGYAPTLKEIAIRCGNKNTSTIHQHVKALQAKGYVSRKTNSPRSLVAETEHQTTIPLLGTIAAGNPIGVFEDPVPIQVPKSMVPQRENYYALRVSGDSMIDEGILDKDVVIIRQQDNAYPGDIVVAIITDEFGNESATLKVYYPRKEKIELKPRNQKLESLFISKKNLQVRGLFKGLIRHNQSE